MNWIERLYEIKNKDLYSQSGEGLLLEYVLRNIAIRFPAHCYDIGGGDGFYLSNTKHPCSTFHFTQNVLDKENGHTVTVENVFSKMFLEPIELVSIDIDGNDYWILEKVFSLFYPSVVIAEFNPAFIDSRTIKYNPNHEWAGDDYYGFSFEAGKKLAEKHGYEIIFNVANMNLIMVRKDLINVSVPPVTYKQDNFFKESNREDWEFV